MATTMEDVRSHLDPDEPNYTEAVAQLGPEAIPHLEVLVGADDSMLASKAAYLAALIDTDQSIHVLAAAAQSTAPEVRVAAAAGLEHITSSPVGSICKQLLGDSDVGVRQLAARSYDAVRRRQYEAKDVPKWLASRILDFFNTASSWKDIVNRIQDDPAFGTASLRAYGIRKSVAERILETRNGLPKGKFTTLTQIDNVRGVGGDTFHDIVFSFMR